MTRSYIAALGIIVPCAVTTCLTMAAVVVGLAIAGVSP